MNNAKSRLFHASGSYCRGVTATVLLLLAATLSAPLADASSTHGPRASLEGPSTPCANTALRTTALTNRKTYAPGATVKMRATISNTSAQTCSVVVGGTTPTFSIFNASGVPQWSYCTSLVTPEMCPQYLRVVSLVAGSSFSVTNAWTLPTGVKAPPAGLYRLEVAFRGVSELAEAGFFVGAPTSAPLVLSDAQSGDHVTLRVGQSVAIRLTDSIYRWSVPQSSNANVVVSSATSPFKFVARRLGTAAIRATGTPKCYPRCLLPSRLFLLTVTVTR